MHRYHIPILIPKLFDVIENIHNTLNFIEQVIAEKVLITL